MGRERNKNKQYNDNKRRPINTQGGRLLIKRRMVCSVERAVEGVAIGADSCSLSVTNRMCGISDGVVRIWWEGGIDVFDEGLVHGILE